MYQGAKLDSYKKIQVKSKGKVNGAVEFGTNNVQDRAKTVGENHIPLRRTKTYKW